MNKYIWKNLDLLKHAKKIQFPYTLHLMFLILYNHEIFQKQEINTGTVLVNKHETFEFLQFFH